MQSAVVDDALVASMREHVGVEHEQDLGVLDALTIRRFARAVGETNLLYYDADVAREHGFRDVVAPPNLLVAMLDWTEGSPNEQLRPDGTEPQMTLPGIPQSGYRLLAGGDEMTFHEPVVAGQRISRVTLLEDVAFRESRSGPMAVARVMRRFSADGVLALEAIEIMLVR